MQVTISSASKVIEMDRPNIIVRFLKDTEITPSYIMKNLAKIDPYCFLGVDSSLIIGYEY